MMKHTLRSRIAGTILAVAFPLAALADITNQTIPLPANTNLSLDAGAVAAQGGDIRFTGTSITLVGSATVLNFGGGGMTTYNATTPQTLSLLPSQAYTQTPLTGSSLVPNDVFAVHTQAGNSAKVLIIAVGATSITLEFTTYGAAGGGGGGGGTPGGPSITKIQNNSSNVPQGFPNYGVAPSSLFIVGGSGLSDPADAVLQDTGVGLPSTLNGASISVTVNGVVTHPALYYAIPAQLAAVLPANTPIGDGTLTVSYKGANSNAFPIHVVVSALGINNYNGGLAVAQDPASPTGAIFTFTNSAAVGAVVTLWSTGLGADSAVSDTTLTAGAHTVSTPLQIYVGGVPANDIRYQGSAGYPGVNIINVAVPQGAPLGCHVPVTIIAGGIVSNTVTVPIAAVKGGTCSDTQYGITGDQLSALGGQTTTKSGSVFVIETTNAGTNGVPTQSNIAGASFSQVTGASFSSSGLVSIGGCILNQSVSGSGGTSTGLDAGTITVAGPSGTFTLSSTPVLAGFYSAILGSGAVPTLGGSFVFNNGSGGSQVGKFTASVNFPSTPLTWNNQSTAATVTRSQGLSVTWTGGGSGTYVGITGTSTSGGVTGSYTCIAPVGAQQFTVPSYVLLGMPAGTGTTSVENSTNFSSFTAPGIDNGTAFGAISFSVSSTYN